MQPVAEVEETVVQRQKNVGEQTWFRLTRIGFCPFKQYNIQSEIWDPERVRSQPYGTCLRGQFGYGLEYETVGDLIRGGCRKQENVSLSKTMCLCYYLCTESVFLNACSGMHLHTLYAVPYQLRNIYAFLC
jgi:hypothetical protein